MKNIIIGIIQRLINLIEAALGSFAFGWLDMVSLEYNHMVNAISRAKRER